MLLDSLGDSEIPEQEFDSSELLVRFVAAGSSSIKVDPTDLSTLQQLDVDQWTTEGQIEEERVRVEKEQEEEAMNVEFGGKLEDNLAVHSAFTLALLERLCAAIGEAGTISQAPEVINALTEAKALHADRLVLTDRITKLSSEIVNLSAKLHVCERQKMLIEMDLIRAQANAADAANRASTNAVKDEGAPSTNNATDLTASTLFSSAIPQSTFDAESDLLSKEREKELKQKIDILEKQLSRSEEDKSKADKELTRRLAAPINSSVAVAEQLRNAMDSLREQLKKLQSGQNADLTGLQEKINNLEIGMAQLEASCAAKCREAIGQAEMEIKSMRASRDAMQSSLFRANADLAINNQLKIQVSELQILEATQRAEALKLMSRIKSLSESQEMLQTHLSTSRTRETALEERLNGEMRGNPGSCDPGLEPLATAQQRANETQKELEHAQASINDLILEIDAVSAEEAKSREQTARTLKSMSEGQGSYRSLSEDNSRLHDQIADLQKRHTDMESR